MRLLPGLATLVLSLPGCGDDAATPPDAGPALDAAPDAGSACAYTEQFDPTNDDIIGAGTPEPTGLTFGASFTVCGAIDSTHFDVGEAVVDVDGYTFTVAAEADVLVTVSGAGLDTLELVQLQIYGGAGLGTLIADGTFVGDHAVHAVRLAAGTYELAVIASSAAAIAAPIPYQLRVAADAPLARCAEVTAGGYAEATDGATHDGNDVVLIDRSMSPTQALTASATDAPEATAITVEPALSYRITGTSGSVPQAGSYFDKDTFAFTTGTSTNQVAIRVNWPGSTVDLDYHLFAEGVLPYVHRAIAAATVEDEFRTLPVEPGTTYWLWIGADRSSAGLPVAYTASLCGATFTP